MLNPLICQQQDGELLPGRATALRRERRLAGPCRKGNGSSKGDVHKAVPCLPAKGWGEHQHWGLLCLLVFESGG